MTDVVDPSTDAEHDDAPIYVELGDRVATVSAWENDEVRGPATRVVTAAGDMVTQGVDLARRCAAQFSAGLTDLPAISRPSTIELSLGITLDSELGAFLARAKAGAQIQITMTWKLDGD